MTVTGDTFSTYLRDVWLPEAELTVFHNDSLLGPGGPFEVISPERCPGGTYINVGIDYAVTTHAAAYAVGDAMPAPDSISTVKAYFNKDFYQASAKTYTYYKHLRETGYEGSYVDFDQETKAVQMAAKNLKDLITTTMLTDLEAWIDSTSNFSDAALARGTYTSLVSYEAGSVGSLARADLDDALEAMEDVTYGPVPRSSMAWIMARNQLTNMSTLFTGASTFEMNASSQNMGPIDPEGTMRLGSYGGVPIYVLPDFSTTDILLVNRDKIKIYNWAPLEITIKDLPEAGQSWLLTMGATLVVQDPRTQAKLDAVTA